MKSTKTGIVRILYAFMFSLKGIAAAFKHESAFRIEIVFFSVLFPVSFFVGDNAAEIALLILTLFLVLIAEIINSAIEAVVDRVGEERHELSGRAKDMGSAGVLLSLLLAASVWAIILFT